jgi:hypothetical protein
MKFLNRFNRVLSVGRENYLRVYPNPGFGISFGSRRIAVSWYGGYEVFKRHPQLVWMRSYSLFSRVQRPGGK